MIVTPLYAGDLFAYLQGDGTFSHLTKTHPIPLRYRLVLTLQLVDALAGELFFLFYSSPCFLISVS